MPSNVFRLNGQDFIQGAVNAVVVAIGVVVLGYFQGGDFNVFTANWSAISGEALNVGIKAFVAFMGAYFLADKKGVVLGSIKVR